MNTFGGMRVISDSNALKETEERLFPASRHRSRRIRKKLIKRFGGEFRKVPTSYQIGNHTLLMHPAIYQQLQQQLIRERDRLELKAYYGGFNGKAL